MRWGFGPLQSYSLKRVRQNHIVLYLNNLLDLKCGDGLKLSMSPSPQQSVDFVSCQLSRLSVICQLQCVGWDCRVHDPQTPGTDHQ